MTEPQTKIAELLKTCHLTSGLGNDKHEACSIAAINLGMTGKLTDEIPDCMSLVIGRWIIRIQDAMSEEIRNSEEWKSLLPFAAGTGRELEKERLEIIMDWMWIMVLPELQEAADRGDYGKEWSDMCEVRTAAAANAANAANAKFWQVINPPALLKKLIEVKK